MYISFFFLIFTYVFKCPNNVFSLKFFRLDSRSIFMLDTGPSIFILIGSNVPPQLLQSAFGKFNITCNFQFTYLYFLHS